MPKICLTTPFAGKKHCLEHYKKSVESLDYPKNEMSFLIYDNSNDPAFSKNMKVWAESLGFERVIYYSDNAPHFIIENTTDYSKVMDRVHLIYVKILDMVPDDIDYIWNVEDDISFEPDVLKKLMPRFQEDTRIRSISAITWGRRMQDMDWGVPQVWGFQREEFFPMQPVINQPMGREQLQSTKVKVFRLPEKEFGFEIVGGTAFGCIIWDAKFLKEFKFKMNVDGMKTIDPAYGYRLWKEGKGFHTIDWAVKCKHWWLYNNEVGYSGYDQKQFTNEPWTPAHNVCMAPTMVRKASPGHV
jgi:hypothetical protein